MRKFVTILLTVLIILSSATAYGATAHVTNTVTQSAITKPESNVKEGSAKPAIHSINKPGSHIKQNVSSGSNKKDMVKTGSKIKTILSYEIKDTTK